MDLQSTTVRTAVVHCNRGGGSHNVAAECRMSPASCYSSAAAVVAWQCSSSCNHLLCKFRILNDPFIGAVQIA